MILIQTWQEASKQAYAIRQTVFIEEQGIPKELELDEFDPIAWHALAFWEDQCIGTGRLVAVNQNAGQIGRMAVLADFRGQGFGKAILIQLIDLAANQGMSTLTLHAQVSAIPFYEKFGFMAQGSIYEEAGIPHRNMILLLPISS
ncbi:GNAT family N-acetyltransferase [Polynucleobacter sp. 15G-AUS-farblos]|uniref:GNAT family N-acetyltransferase n=1 Tax=Polynucleobacter sp. 15G-AUS-farblos TaxID=2689094 RepID=UPI00351CD4E7|nr:GNAT family N-acetyltransferase [Polynucleobacter sp. 15G-AUS-farblos]